MSSLTRKMATLSLAGPSRNRSRSRSRRRGPRQRSRSRGRPSQPTTSRQRPKRSNALVDGTAELRKSELFVTVKTNADGTFATARLIDPTSDDSEAKILKGFANIFDQISWKSLSFEWVPTVGYDIAGNIFIGVDWDAQVTKPADATIVAAMEPNIMAGLHQPIRMTVPARKYQPQNWLRMHRTGQDTELAKLAIFASGPKDTALGFVKIHYDIRFQGTRAT